jgi:hypothetical protein
VLLAAGSVAIDAKHRFGTVCRLETLGVDRATLVFRRSAYARVSSSGGVLAILIVRITVAVFVRVVVLPPITAPGSSCPTHLATSICRSAGLYRVVSYLS